jgi:hypothetical protein
MEPREAEAIREAVADAVRVIADLGDVLMAIGAAARLAGDALERVERDLIAIASLIDERSHE